MPRANLTRQLAEAVASAFEVAGFAPADLLKGQIHFTDLPWQAPPLHATAKLAGVPLHEYLDCPLPVDSAKLYDYYDAGLSLLHCGPEEITDSTGYKGLRWALPGLRPGERNLVLPLYDGWPAGDTNTGPIFALEMAHLFRTSAEDVQDFVEDDDNYHAVTPHGVVGIVDGFVSVQAENWDMSLAGAVPAMLEQPRGLLTTTCAYDTIARLRSALYEAPEKFTEFVGVDLALQTLRILSNGHLCRELQAAVEQMSRAGFRRRAKIEAYKQAIGVMEDWLLSDRTKIGMLQEILMPTHMNLQMFSRVILDPKKVLPAVLSARTEQRILHALRERLARVDYTNQRATKDSNG